MHRVGDDPTPPPFEAGALCRLRYLCEWSGRVERASGVSPPFPVFRLASWPKRRPREWCGGLASNQHLRLLWISRPLVACVLVGLPPRETYDARARGHLRSKRFVFGPGSIATAVIWSPMSGSRNAANFRPSFSQEAMMD